MDDLTEFSNGFLFYQRLHLKVCTVFHVSRCRPEVVFEHVWRLHTAHGTGAEGDGEWRRRLGMDQFRACCCLEPSVNRLDQLIT